MGVARSSSDDTHALFLSAIRYLAEELLETIHKDGARASHVQRPHGRHDVGEKASMCLATPLAALSSLEIEVFSFFYQTWARGFFARPIS